MTQQLTWHEHGSSPVLEPFGLMFCLGCGRHLTLAEQDYMLQDRAIEDCVCGEERSEVGVYAREDQAHLLADPQRASGERWFHATLNADWLEKIEPGLSKTGEPIDLGKPYIHLGTVDAAFDRARCEFFPERGRDEEKVFYLYEVVILPETVFVDQVAEDAEAGFALRQWPRWTRHPKGNHLGDKHGLLYVNYYEAPGSISALVASDRFAIVSRTEFRCANRVDFFYQSEKFLDTQEVLAA